MKPCIFNIKCFKRKTRLFNWIKKYGRLPSYRSEKKLERALGCALENFMAKASVQYDPAIREWVLANFKRKVTNKRPHDKKARVGELVNFLKTKQRVPSVLIPDERRIFHTMDNYTRPGSDLFDAAVRKMIEQSDACAYTLIPKKYRQSINTAMNGQPVKIEEVFLNQQTKTQE